MRKTAALRIAYMMQNVGVALTTDVGQAILIKHTIRGLKSLGHQMDAFWLQGREVCGLRDLDQPQTAWATAQGVTGIRPFHLIEGGIRRLQGQLNIPYLALFDSARFYNAARNALKSYNICHEYAGLMSVGAAYACRRLGIPYVLTADADLLLEREVVDDPLTGMQAAWAKWTAQQNYRLADRIICVSQPAKANLVKKWGVSADKIVVIPNGVDADRFDSRQYDQTAVRQQWQLGDSPIVMFVGGFQKWHGIDKLVQSFAQLLPNYPQVKLVLVGDGPAREEIDQLIVSLGIDHNVLITGRVKHEEVPQLLSVADIVTVPYPKLSQELWFSPLKLYEYMAAGKGIVASRAGQISDVISDEVNGLLIEPGDVAALTRSMSCLLKRPLLREQLGQAARRKAEREHSWQRQFARLESVYYDVL